MRETVTIQWDLLGAKLATLSDVEQGAFFNGFLDELQSFESRYATSMQACAIGKQIKPSNRKAAKEIFEFFSEDK